MRKRFALLAILLLVLAGCGSTLPAEARTMVLRGFDPAAEPHIDTAQQVELMAEDLALGAAEVWCINVIYTCWSCDYGEWRTCADNRLVRRIDGRWEGSGLLTEEDQALWEARGCQMMDPVVSR